MIQGWVNVFQARGHEAYVWNGSKIFDTFNQFRPDVYIGASPINHELGLSIQQHKPQLYLDKFSFAADSLRYYKVESGRKGVYYIGDYNHKKAWIDKYIIPRCIHGDLIRIFGYGDWPVPNYMGFCSDQTEREVYSGGIILNFTDYYNEKPFKVAACQGICLTNHTPEMENLFGPDLLFSCPNELNDKIEFYKDENNYRKAAEKSYNLVMKKHTYYHRWCQEEWL